MSDRQSTGITDPPSAPAVMRQDAVVRTQDRVRVLRILEYDGPRDWVEGTVSRAIHGRRHIAGGASITGVTLTAYPEVLEQAKRTPAEEFQAQPQPASVPLFSREPEGHDR